MQQLKKNLIRFNDINESNSNIYYRISTLICLLAIFSIALAYRMYFKNNQGGQDYLTWAMQHYFGGITPFYLDKAKIFLQQFTYRQLSYPPGYPVFIALTKLLLGKNLQTLRIVQLSINSLMIFPLYFITRWLNINKFFSLLGCLLFALFPFWGKASTYLLAEWISPSIIILLLYLLLASKKFPKHTFWLLLLSGLNIGIGAIFRPDLVLLIIPATIWLFINYKIYKPISIKVASLWLCYLIILFSWGLHNKLHHNAWVFTSTSGGAGLYEGLGEIKNPYGYILSDTQTENMIKKNGYKDFHTAAANRFLIGAYLKVLKEHPLYVMKTIIYRWGHILTPNGLHEFKTFMMILTLIAIILALKNLSSLFILLLPMTYAMLSIGLTHYEPRYVAYAALTYLFGSMYFLNKVESFLIYKYRYAHSPYFRIFALSLTILLPLTICIGFHRPINRLFFQNPINAFQYQYHTYLINNKKIKISKSYDLKDFSFSNFSPGVTRGKNKKSLFIKTNKLKYAYQFGTYINTKHKIFTTIKYNIKLIKGGVELGLIGNKSGETIWLKTLNFNKPGNYSGELPLILEGQKRLLLVFANNQTKNTHSIYKINKLKLTLYQVK